MSLEEIVKGIVAVVVVWLGLITLIAFPGIALVIGCIILTCLIFMVGAGL